MFRFLLSLVFCSTSFILPKTALANCEQFPSVIVRYGDKVTFYNKMHNYNDNNITVTVENYNVDFSGSQSKPKFSLLTKKVNPNTEIKILESKPIQIDTKEDFAVTYITDYSLDKGLDGGSTCVVKPYKVTYCGDSSLQLKHEQCEIGQIGPNQESCNSNCMWNR